MKQYKKQYENIYTSPKSTHKCYFPKISNDLGLTAKEYTSFMRKNILKMERQIFENLVKIEWLSRRFIYDGTPRTKPRSNGLKADSAYGVWMRHFVGMENRLLGMDDTYCKVRGYFPNFFPNFLENNPFKDKNKYKYPYKYMTFEFLVILYKMKNRMEILDYCEKKRMRYTEFCDYIINYIYSYNDDVGYHFYEWKETWSYMPYVGINKEFKQYEGREKT